MTSSDVDGGERSSGGVVVVGYGEVGTKSSRVRSRMLERLAENLRALSEARALDATVERAWARLFVWCADPDAAAGVASEAPGVVFARPATACRATRDDIERTLASTAAGHPGGTFAVRATRDGPDGAHDFSSPGVERWGGARVRETVEAETETGVDVDLDDPDVTYRVEVRGDRAFVSRASYAGPGGIPAGTQGRVVVLVSGGIDSPVAAWELLRRGCSVVPVYVSLGDYGGVDHRARAVETVRTVGRRVPHLDTDLRVVPAGDVVASLVEATDETRMLSLRRVMLRAAAAVASDEGAHSVATGEAVGQKSSQTGPNLAVTDAAAPLPVHRPLLTWDKADVVAAARDLGTFPDSTLPVGCERVAPSHPETSATLEAVEAAEPAKVLDRAAAAGGRATRIER